MWVKLTKMKARSAPIFRPKSFPNLFGAKIYPSPNVVILSCACHKLNHNCLSQGRVEVTIGKEEHKFIEGPFTTFGEQMLDQVGR